MGKKKLLIWGYYGAGNYGDELMLQTILENLPSIKNYEVYYSVKAINPNPKFEGEQVPFFNRRSSNKVVNMIKNIFFLLKTMAKMDVVILGGGTQYFELSKKDWFSIYLQYLVFLIVKIRGKKIMNIAVGIGKMQTKLGKRYLRKLFKLSTFNSVRDKYSLQTLIDIGVPKSIIELWNDLTYAIPHSKHPKTKMEKTKIGLNFFDFYNYIQHNTEKDKNYREEVESLIKTLIENNFEPHFFALQKGDGGKDLEFNEEVTKEFSYPIHYFADDMAKFSELIGEMDINIGLRYHFAVLSFQTHTPVIGLNYQPKVKREFEYFNLEKWTINMEEFSSSLAMDMIQKLQDEKEDYLNTLKSKLETTFKNQSNNIKKVDKLLND